MAQSLPLVEWTHVHTADCVSYPVDHVLDFVIKTKSLSSSAARWRFRSDSINCLKWNHVLVQEEDLLSFFECDKKTEGQLCFSKKIDFEVNVTLPFIKNWIKFLFHQESTKPAESVCDTLSFLSLNRNRAYLSSVIDDLNIAYAIM